jgi:hemerythrin
VYLPRFRSGKTKTEQVLEELFRDEDEIFSEEEEVLEEDDREKVKLREHLAKYESDQAIDRDFFVDKAAEVLLPIVSQAALITRSDGKFCLLMFS